MNVYNHNKVNNNRSLPLAGSPVVPDKSTQVAASHFNADGKNFFLPPNPSVPKSTMAAAAVRQLQQLPAESSLGIQKHITLLDQHLNKIHTLQQQINQAKASNEATQETDLKSTLSKSIESLPHSLQDMASLDLSHLEGSKRNELRKLLSDTYDVLSLKSQETQEQEKTDSQKKATSLLITICQSLYPKESDLLINYCYKPNKDNLNEGNLVFDRNINGLQSLFNKIQGTNTVRKELPKNVNSLDGLFALCEHSEQFSNLSEKNKVDYDEQLQLLLKDKYKEMQKEVLKHLNRYRELSDSDLKQNLWLLEELKWFKPNPYIKRSENECRQIMDQLYGALQGPDSVAINPKNTFDNEIINTLGMWNTEALEAAKAICNNLPYSSTTESTNAAIQAKLAACTEEMITHVCQDIHAKEMVSSLWKRMSYPSNASPETLFTQFAGFLALVDKAISGPEQQKLRSFLAERLKKEQAELAAAQARSMEEMFPKSQFASVDRLLNPDLSAEDVKVALQHAEFLPAGNFAIAACEAFDEEFEKKIAELKACLNKSPGMVEYVNATTRKVETVAIPSELTMFEKAEKLLQQESSSTLPKLRKNLTFGYYDGVQKRRKAVHAVLFQMLSQHPSEAVRKAYNQMLETWKTKQPETYTKLEKKQNSQLKQINKAMAAAIYKLNAKNTKAAVQTINRHLIAAGKKVAHGMRDKIVYQAGLITVLAGLIGGIISLFQLNKAQQSLDEEGLETKDLPPADVLDETPLFDDLATIAKDDVRGIDINTSYVEANIASLADNQYNNNLPADQNPIITSMYQIDATSAAPTLVYSDEVNQEIYKDLAIQHQICINQGLPDVDVAKLACPAALFEASQNQFLELSMQDEATLSEEDKQRLQSLSKYFAYDPETQIAEEREGGKILYAVHLNQIEIERQLVAKEALGTLTETAAQAIRDQEHASNDDVTLFSTEAITFFSIAGGAGLLSLMSVIFNAIDRRKKPKKAQQAESQG